MDRNTLELKSSIVLQEQLHKQLEQLKEKIKNQKLNYQNTKEKIFYSHYNCSALSTYKSYVTRLTSLCIQGGQGYYWWLHAKDMPKYCHCVIDVPKYDVALPTQQELDAYWVLYDTDIKIPNKSEHHIERWGN